MKTSDILNRAPSNDSSQENQSPIETLDMPSIDHLLELVLNRIRSKYLKYSDFEWERLTWVIGDNKRSSGTILWKNAKRKLEERMHKVFKKIKSKYYSLRRKAVIGKLRNHRHDVQIEMNDNS